MVTAHALTLYITPFPINKLLYFHVEFTQCFRKSLQHPHS